MNLDDCLKEGLLKKTKPSFSMSQDSLARASSYIDKARSNLDLNNYDLVVVCAYTSMFHAARALLFRDGYKERSHICLISFIEEKYPEIGSYARQVDLYRRARHNALYNPNSIQSLADAEVAVESAKAFLTKVESMLID